VNRAGAILTWTFVALHALALCLGLFGLLVALPHPQLFAGNAPALAFYASAMNDTGGTGIFLGTAAMLAFGIWRLGSRRTLLFFCAATIISATAELTGTKTGWPFGGYEYTSFLGPKLLGRVPAAIPLSWFYMGFASLILADAIVAGRVLWSLVLGTWLLVSWDLVLDPSMAAPNLQYIHFWIWHETGPYFGMPLRNLGGWFGTGLLFIAVGRGAWRERVAPRVPVAVPYAIYAINIIWSMILSIAAGMWPTAIAAILVSLVPAALAFAGARRPRA
jgi:carotene biosynthesis associated membrane protein